MCQKLRNGPGGWQMPGPRAVQNLQMPYPRDWQGGQMPRSSPGGRGGARGQVELTDAFIYTFENSFNLTHSNY